MNKIEKFIEMQETDNTKRTYKNALNQYFKRNKCNPDNYLESQRDFSIDLWNFYQSLNKYAPTTKRTYVGVIKDLFEWYEIPIDFKIKKRIKRKLKNCHPITLDKAPTQQELKEILTYGDLRARALFLTLSSSGMRIGEALTLLPEQLDLNSSPARIHILHSHAKNNRPRICFISDEAKDSLKQWLTPHKFVENDGREYYESERERYLRYVCNKLENFLHINKDRNDKRVFPFNLSSARNSWMDMIKRAGYTNRNPETGIHDFHIQSLRKYFESNMKTKIPTAIVEQLVGHAGYLTEAYHRYTEEQLSTFYLQGVSSVKVFDTSPESNELRKKYDELKESNLIMKREIQELKERNLFDYLTPLQYLDKVRGKEERFTERDVKRMQEFFNEQERERNKILLELLKKEKRSNK